MVNTESARRLAPSLFLTGKQWILESLHGVISSNGESNVSSRDEEEDSQEELAQLEATSTEYLVYNWLESMFAWFQVIILWHEPKLSLCAISGLLTSFLLLTYFVPRFYATVLIAIFIYNLNKYWFKYVWPDIRVPPGAEREMELKMDVDRFTYLHPQVMTLAELNVYLGNLKELGEIYLSKLVLLRRQRPIAFCSLICSILSCTAYVGNRINGVNLIFWSIAVIMTAPGVYQHLLSESTREWLRLKVSMILQKILESQKRDHEVDRSQSERDISGKLCPNQESPSSSEERDISSRRLSGDEPLVPTIACCTKSLAVSFYEKLRKKSFSLVSSEENKVEAGEASQVGTMLLGGGKNRRESIGSVPTPAVDVPRNLDQDNHRQLASSSTGDQLRRRKKQPEDEEDDFDDCAAKCERNVREAILSSNSSLSLIESDEEQQDGFVLL